MKWRTTVPGYFITRRFLRIEITEASLYTPTYVARSIGINFWSARNDHVLVILLYNPGNSFSLTGTRKPAGTYGRTVAVRSMKCNSAGATQAVLNFRRFHLSPEVVTKQVHREGDELGQAIGYHFLAWSTRGNIFQWDADSSALPNHFPQKRQWYLIQGLTSQRDEMIARLILAQFTRFKISCSQKCSREIVPTWKIEFYLTFAGGGSHGLQLENCQITSLWMSRPQEPVQTGTKTLYRSEPDVPWAVN